MNAPPGNGRLDSTAAMLRAPYTFVGQEAGRLGSDVFEARVMLAPATCMVGPAAAELFYSPGLFVRDGASPQRITDVLFGRGGVQYLDGPPHGRRKRMFVGMMDAPALDRIEVRARELLAAEAAGWKDAGEVELYDAAARVLMRAACDWAGVPLPDAEFAERTATMRALFETPAALGPRHWRGRRGRHAADAWARGIIRGLRARRIETGPDAPARRIAEWRDAEGRELPDEVAAVELVNVLRPTVANAIFVVFLAHALDAHPEAAARTGRDADYRRAFVQEVRRHYPFFPLLAARATGDIGWHGIEIPRGRRVILDLYGTNHHPEAWDEPHAFSPERFLDWPGDPFAMIPQGGGEHSVTHRCPGEWITIRLMDVFAETLAGLRFRPARDIAPDFGATPALPRHGAPLVGVAAR